MNLVIVIVSCASVVLMMTLRGVTADGDCNADRADQVVTIEKLSTVPVWYIQTSNQPIVPCTEFQFTFSVQNNNNGFLTLKGIYIGRVEGWTTFFLNYTAPGQYDAWRAEDVNNPSATPLGKITFVYYGEAGFTMIKCFSPQPNYYYTATAEEVASDDTLNTLEQSLLTLYNVNVDTYRYYCNKPLY